MAQLTQQQRHINNLQANQSKRHEQSIKQFSRQFGTDIMALTPRQVLKIRRQRQRLQAKAFRQKQRQSQV